MRRPLRRLFRRLCETTWRGEPITPGFVRIRGAGAPYLIPDDLKFEVQQRDGAWIPLRGVCEWNMKITPGEVVSAMVLLELGELDLGTVPTITTEAKP